MAVSCIAMDRDWVITHCNAEGEPITGSGHRAVIGDVVGHDVQAAAALGQRRRPQPMVITPDGRVHRLTAGARTCCCSGLPDARRQESCRPPAVPRCR
jgi:hypothetical protein